MQKSNAQAPCSPPTSTRRALQKGALFLSVRIARKVEATAQGRLHKTRPVRRCILPSERDWLMTRVPRSRN